MKKYFWISLLILSINSQSYGVSGFPAKLEERNLWVRAKFEGKAAEKAREARIVVLANYDEVQKNSRSGQPLKLGGKEYTRGLFCHANSKLIVELPEPGKRFTAMVGVDDAAGPGSVIFSVIVKDEVKFRSEVLRGGGIPVVVDVDLAGAKEFILEVGEGGDNISFDQSDWADAKVTQADGQEIWLGDVEIVKKQEGYTPIVPFSFLYDGQPFGEIVSRFKVERTHKNLDETREQYIQKYTDTTGGLEVRCEGIKYLDYPTVEWVVYLKNTGEQDTPILENIQALDIQLPQSNEGEFVLHYHTGGHSGPGDFEPLKETLGPNSEKLFTTWGGFPTANNLPFFNLQSQQEGVIIAIGWPGMWAAQFKRDSNNNLLILIGQEHTHLRLQPGEEIRTPLIALQFWTGDRTRSQNVWRRWMIAHNLPRPGGKLPEPILAGISSGDADLAYQSEENQKIFLDGYQKREIPIQYWWIDAGWYPNKGNTWQDLLGTWEADPKRFPHGLRAVSDSVHQRGMKMILWFEPERVVKDSWLFENHPEWLLGDGDARFFNHGNPEANEWLTNHIDSILTQEGIDLYRQDFAVFSRPFWEQEDQKNPDRQGMTENKHVVGYLKYLDELCRRHPEMLIDICSAGGKRLELENLRRAVPLWRSDYVSEPVGTQCQTYGLAYWLPFFGTGIYAQDVYTFRSNMCPSTLIIWDVRNDNPDYPYLRQLIQQWREVVDNYYGDYYPLTPYSTGSDQWMGWQYDRPEVGEGVVQMFCRTGTMYDSGICKLNGLDLQASYIITDYDTEATTVMTGRELMEKGLRIIFKNQPAATLIRYQKQ